jgi:hypothetical protein
MYLNLLNGDLSVKVTATLTKKIALRLCHVLVFWENANCGSAFVCRSQTTIKKKRMEKTVDHTYP